MKLVILTLQSHYAKKQSTGTYQISTVSQGPFWFPSLFLKRSNLSFVQSVILRTGITPVSSSMSGFGKKILDLYASTQATPAPDYSLCQRHMSCHQGLKLTFTNSPNMGKKLAGVKSILQATLAGEVFDLASVWTQSAFKTKPLTAVSSLKILQNIHFSIDYWFAFIIFIIYSKVETAVN